jgi:hypothetical protein
MAPSRLSSSLSRARSYLSSLAATACEGDEVLRQLTSRNRCDNKEASPSKHRHRLKTYLANGEARLEEASIIQLHYVCYGNYEDDVDYFIFVAWCVSNIDLLPLHV